MQTCPAKGMFPALTCPSKMHGTITCVQESAAGHDYHVLVLVCGALADGWLCWQEVLAVQVGALVCADL